MKKKSNGFKLLTKTFLTYDWWKFLLILLVGVITLPYIAKAKTRIKDNEIIHVFVTGEIKEPDFNNDYQKAFAEEDGILKVRTTAIKSTDSKYGVTFDSVFGIECDLVIVPESFLDKDIFLASTYTFNDSESTILRDNKFEIYNFHETPRGIKIFEKENDVFNNFFNLNTYFAFEETSYLFIDKTSTNIDTIGRNQYSVAFNSLINLLNL